MSKNDKLANLKNIAGAISKHLNHEFQKAVAYVPNTDTIEKVTVHKWLPMSEAFQNATKLPGLPVGNITHVYGKPDAGKSTMIMEGIVNAQQNGILPILILTEHKFDFNRISEWMGGDPDAMLVLHAESLEEIYGYIEKILRDLEQGQIVIEAENGKDLAIPLEGQDCFIFVDSIGNTMADSELEYEVTEVDKSMGKAAKTIKTLTKRVNRLLSKVRSKCGILFVNQSYMSMPSYGPSVETPYGGDGIPYSCVLNIRLRRIADLKMTYKGEEAVIGAETKLEVKKNHITHLKPISKILVTAEGFMSGEKQIVEDYKKRIKEFHGKE